MTAAITRMAAVAILFLAAPRAHAQDAFDYRAADSVALATPAEASSPAVLAARLTAGLATDREKARSIYRWMTHNIEYDADAFFGNRFAIPLQTPQAVLRRRKAVCEGFSLLYVTLARSAGLEAVEVIGFAKAFSGDVNNPVRRQKHAWNAVRVDGRWHALDTSWGAGDIEGRRFVRRFRGFYFFTPPEKLIYSHMAADPAFQGLATPLAVDAFDRQPNLQRDFWELGFTADEVRRAERSTRDFVNVFPVPRHPIRVLQAPLDARLAPGVAHSFSLHAPGATGVAAVTGGKWHKLTAEGSDFAGTAALDGDDMMLVARYPDFPTGRVVLRYRSSAPATRARGADR